MGEINPSIRRMEKAILSCHQQRQYVQKRVIWAGLAMLVTLAGLLWVNGFDIRNWLYLSEVNLALLIAVFFSTAGFLHYAGRENTLSQRFEYLRKTLMIRIHEDFCSCRSACQHQEEFLTRMLKQGINLDY